jgi:aminoglycoside 6'-N-acetyltransferase I
MVDFVETVSEPRASELLAVALRGRGAFRRFKDTLHRVGHVEDWYAFKHNAFVKLARDWCEENGLPYDDIMPKEQPRHRAIDKCRLDMIIIPLHPNAVSEAAGVLQDALKYSRHVAEQEIHKMKKKPNILLTAIAGNCVVGIIGAIHQYGVTGWELHPLAVLTEYQRHGVGSALVEALEREVYGYGCVMLYLGSDDETGTTTLYGADLYDDTFEKLKNIQNTGGHPYTFYEKLGYKIVGVLPDANGVGKPDIWMAKRIRRV